MSMKLQVHKERHGNDKDASRQSSWEEAMMKSTVRAAIDVEERR